MTMFTKKLLAALWCRIGWLNDFFVFRRHALPFSRYAASFSPAQEAPALLLVAGNGMNIMWAQLWPLLSLPLLRRGYRGLVLTYKRQRLLNAYYRLMHLERVFIDALEILPLSPDVLEQIEAAKHFDEYKNFKYKSAPVGQIALSTYSRNVISGVIRLDDPKVANYVKGWMRRVCQTIDAAEILFSKKNIQVLYVTEVFMEEYGAFYYAALNARLNVVRFNGTVRDKAFVIQHLSRKNDRIHHASIDPTTWENLKQRSDDEKIERELGQNFKDRYGDKWHRSKRNHANTRILSIEEARTQLGIAPGRKVAVIYSHILYDTLFFFGTDLFKDYADWLVETTRAAIANPHLDWLIKVHPSNIWRGEINTQIKGNYEEERILSEKLGALPPHVRIVAADTGINPLTWFQLADYGITVRGTSGLEMASFGKAVVTAGTGRYEGNGFTYDPKSIDEYLDMLKRLHELPMLSAQQTCWAKRYAHALFVLKPYSFDFVSTHLRFGAKKVSASDDLLYLPRQPENPQMPLSEDLENFGDWVLRPEEGDLLMSQSIS